MKRLWFLIFTFSFILSSVWAPIVAASETTGTVINDPAYAWGENIGWIHLNPAHGGLIITDTAVTGYAWSRQYGWINFGPFTSGQKVANDGEGHLSGSAWIAGRGWLDMSDVAINTSGIFYGVAGEEGTPVGRVTFGCDECEVKTDWRAISRRQSGGGGGGPAFFPPQVSVPTSVVSPVAPVENIPAEPTSPETLPLQSPDSPSGTGANPDVIKEQAEFKQEVNKPLVLQPHESGYLVKDVEGEGQIKINFFKGSAESAFTLDVAAVAVDLHGYDPVIRPIGKSFFDITALDLQGKPLPLFSAPLKISLPVPQQAEASFKDMGVYRLDLDTGDWVLVSDTAVTGESVIFYSNEVGRFAIIDAPGRPERIHPSRSPIPDFKPLIAAAAAFGLALYVYAGLKR